MCPHVAMRAPGGSSGEAGGGNEKREQSIKNAICMKDEAVGT